MLSAKLLFQALAGITVVGGCVSGAVLVSQNSQNKNTTIVETKTTKTLPQRKTFF